MPADLKHRVGLHETDAAGVMFAGQIITLAHSAYEQALAVAGCDLAELIRDGRFALPLLRCEADFRGPLRHGEDLGLRVRLLERGEQDYRVRVTLAAERVLAVVEQVHVCIDQQRRRCSLPPSVVAALDRLGRVED